MIAFFSNIIFLFFTIPEKSSCSILKQRFKIKIFAFHKKQNQDSYFQERLKRVFFFQFSNGSETFFFFFTLNKI